MNVWNPQVWMDVFEIPLERVAVESLANGPSLREVSRVFAPKPTRVIHNLLVLVHPHLPMVMMKKGS